MSDLPGENSSPLTSIDKNEWFDVWRSMKPSMTRDDFETEWDAFQQAKADHERQMRTH